MNGRTGDFLSLFMTNRNMILFKSWFWSSFIKIYEFLKYSTVHKCKYFIMIYESNLKEKFPRKIFLTPKLVQLYLSSLKLNEYLSIKKFKKKFKKIFHVTLLNNKKVNDLIYSVWCDSSCLSRDCFFVVV